MSKIRLVVMSVVMGAVVVPSLFAGPGRQSVPCGSASYQCPGDPKTYTATCSGSGNVAEGEAAKGWTWELASDYICGNYTASKCPGSPVRPCQPQTKAFPSTKVNE